MRVSQFLIIVQVMVQVALGLVVAGLFWWRRSSASGDGRLDEAYRGQFELPVLFYAGSLFAFAMRIVDERILFFATLFALAQVTGAVFGLLLRNEKGQAVAGLVSVFAAAVLWVMIAAHFVNSGF
ncbi:MAG: hypothetical protein APF80_05660 [Alphaproteobacteria bacterium BRH_c36]|nr:MAG: hypothetical protein APF80_05660 [Alphaproteobacteria bacterium BRH_c36]